MSASAGGEKAPKLKLARVKGGRARGFTIDESRDSDSDSDDLPPPRPRSKSSKASKGAAAGGSRKKSVTGAAPDPGSAKKTGTGGRKQSRAKAAPRDAGSAGQKKSLSDPDPGNPTKEKTRKKSVKTVDGAESENEERRSRKKSVKELGDGTPKKEEGSSTSTRKKSVKGPRNRKKSSQSPSEVLRKTSLKNARKQSGAAATAARKPSAATKQSSGLVPAVIPTRALHAISASMELSATVSDKLMHKTTEEERAQQDQLDDEEEHNFEMGLDLLMTKNAGDDNSLENEHGILKKYQNKDGHGETGGNGNESNPYLSFIQAQELKIKYHPHRQVNTQDEDTGVVRISYEQLPLSTSTGWHVLKGDAFVTTMAIAIFFLIIAVFWVTAIATMKAIAEPGAGAILAHRYMVLAALLVFVIVAILCLIATASCIESLTSKIPDPFNPSSREKIYEYGVGVVLYFRWLKFLACLFLCISLLSVPALYFYHSGTVLNLEALQGLEKLASLTLGSIGESTPVCYQREGLDSKFFDQIYHANHSAEGFINVQCPAGQITEIAVRYGNPFGWCGCHRSFRPDEQGTCTPPVIKDESASELDRMNFKYVLNQRFSEKYMHADTLQRWKDSSMLDFGLLQRVMGGLKWTRAKEKLLRQDCCGTNFPVEFFHVPTANPSCNSHTMQAIAETSCLGKSSCNLTMGEHVQQDVLNSEVWTPGYDPNNETHSRVIKKTIAEGFTNESKAGCEATGFKRMLVTAKCYNPYIVVTHGHKRMTLTKTTMAFIVISCDVCGCTLFLIMVWWLSMKEEDEVALFDAATTTCEDYSLMLAVLPSQQEGGKDEETGEELDGLQKLTLDLKRHIETHINGDKAVKISKHWRGQRASEITCTVDQVHFGLNNFELIQKKKQRVKWEKQELKYRQNLLLLTQIHKGISERAKKRAADAVGEKVTTKPNKHDTTQLLSAPPEFTHQERNARHQAVLASKKVTRRLKNVEQKLKRIDLQIVRLLNKLERDSNKKLDAKELMHTASNKAETDSLEAYKMQGRSIARMGTHRLKAPDAKAGSPRGSPITRVRALSADDGSPLTRARALTAELTADAAKAAAAAASGGLKSAAHAASGGLKLGAELLEAANEKATTKLHATTAFITFATAEGRHRTLETFKPARCCGLLGGADAKIKFREVSLKFEDAPNPGNVYWENLGISKFERRVRELLTFVFTVAVLAASAGVIFQAKAEQAAAALKYPPVTCPAVVPSISDVEDAYMDGGFKPNGLIDCYCRTKLLDIVQGQFEDFDTCKRPSSLETCKRDGNGQPIYSEKLCHSWFTQKLRIQALNVSSVLVVLVVNLLLSTMMRLLVKFERRSSRTAELVSIAKRVFYASFINTALISLVIQGNLSAFTDSRTPMKGDHEDFTVAWYSTAGTAFMLTMMLNIFVPHAKVWAMYPLHAFKIWFDGFKCCAKPCQTHIRSKQITQHDLQELLVGPEWELAARYGQILNVIFVTTMFSSMMPLLNFLAVANFIGIYFVDKLAFLRLYKTPPMYDETLALAAAKQMNLAIVIHCAVGAWAYSNLEILQPVAGMGSPTDLAAHGLSGHLESTTSFDSTSRAPVLTTIFHDRLFKAVPSIWLYIVFPCLCSILLALKEFFLYEITTALRFLGLSSGPSVKEEEGVHDYYASLTDATLAMLEKEPRLLGTLQPEEKVLSKVKEELEQRIKQRELDRMAELRASERRRTEHERMLNRLRKRSQTVWLMTKFTGKLFACCGKFAKSLYRMGGHGRNHGPRRVQIKETTRRMVGLESYAMAQNPDYWYMKHASSMKELREDTVQNLQNEAAWLAVYQGSKLSKAIFAEANKLRPKVLKLLRQLGWDEVEPEELVEATGLREKEVYTWLSGQEVKSTVTTALKTWVRNETAGGDSSKDTDVDAVVAELHDDEESAVANPLTAQVKTPWKAKRASIAAEKSKQNTKKAVQERDASKPKIAVEKVTENPLAAHIEARAGSIEAQAPWKAKRATKPANEKSKKASSKKGGKKKKAPQQVRGGEVSERDGGTDTVGLLSKMVAAKAKEGMAKEAKQPPWKAKRASFAATKNDLVFSSRADSDFQVM